MKGFESSYFQPLVLVTDALITLLIAAHLHFASAWQVLASGFSTIPLFSTDSVPDQCHQIKLSIQTIVDFGVYVVAAMAIELRLAIRSGCGNPTQCWPRNPNGIPLQFS